MDSPTRRARQLRKDLTAAERKLWHAVRARRLRGHKFRRQFWLGDYIVDFVCVERRLIVEIDGGQHAVDVVYDSRRDAALGRLGFRVVRYWNSEVLGNLEGVLLALVEELKR